MENNEVRRKKIYTSMAALKPVADDINEASKLISEEQQFLRDNPAFEALGAVGGIGAGGVLAAGALFTLGTTGLSAAGITSGLAAAGAVVGGGMAAGVFVLAAPIVVLAGAGVGIGKLIKNSGLEEKKLEIYRNALRNLAIIHSILSLDYTEINQTKEDRDRLGRLSFLQPVLMNYCFNLQKDLDLVEDIEVAIVKNGIDGLVEEINSGDIQLERDSLLSPAKKSQAKENLVAIGYEAKKLLGMQQDEGAKAEAYIEANDEDVLFSELTEEERIEDLNPNKLDKVDVSIAVIGGLIGGIASCFIKGVKLEKLKENKSVMTLMTFLGSYLDKNLSKAAKDTLKKQKPEDFEKNVKFNGVDGIKKEIYLLCNNPLVTLLVNSINRIAEIKKRFKENPELNIKYEIEALITDLVKELSKAIKDYDFMMSLPKSVVVFLEHYNCKDIFGDKFKPEELAKKLLEGDFSFNSFVKNSIPSILVDLLIRISYSIKRYNEGVTLDECVPSSIDRDKYPKLSTMMLIGYSISVLVNGAKCAFKRDPTGIDIHQWFKLSLYLYDLAKYKYTMLKRGSANGEEPTSEEQVA